MWTSLAAIAIGAALGAILRWALSVWLNGALPQLPPGTLAANLIGGYLVGVAVVVFIEVASLPPAWRLFVVTGLLGGLTTFSTFSAEVVEQLLHGRAGWASAIVLAHVAGSLLATLAGVASARWWFVR